jgi:hypothetical protein
LVQQIEYNLRYRWFVGLYLDDAVWNHSSFSANRERLLIHGACPDGKPSWPGGGCRDHAGEGNGGAEVAKRMTGRTVKKPGATVGADKAYAVPAFVQALCHHQVMPHVAQKAQGSAVDGRTTRHAGYRISLKLRKRIEEIFGWSKTVGGLRKTRFRGLAKVKAQTVFTISAYHLTRIGGLFGWGWAPA